MYGAIIGDICGSRYVVYDVRRKDIELFPDDAYFTDDTVMSVAVAHALMDTKGQQGLETYQALIKSMQYYGMLYPHAGYGTMFRKWLKSSEPKPYGSYGNGAGMRVSSIATLANSLEEAMYLAELSASPTHNDPEGIKGAKAIAGCAYLAKIGKDKTAIKRFVQHEIKYNLDFTCDGIRDDNVFVESCQVTCPQAIVAFLEGENFEDCIRNAISIGGDSDTIAAMTGTIAEHMYPIPVYMIQQVNRLLPEPLLSQVKRLEQYE